MDIDSSGNLPPVDAAESTRETADGAVKTSQNTNVLPAPADETAVTHRKKVREKSGKSPANGSEPKKPTGRVFSRPIAALLRACMYIPTAVLLIAGVRMFTLTFGTKLLFVSSGTGRQSKYYLLYIIIGVILGAAAYFIGKKFILSVPKNENKAQEQNFFTKSNATDPSNAEKPSGEPTEPQKASELSAPNVSTVPQPQQAPEPNAPKASGGASDKPLHEKVEPNEKASSPRKCPSCGADIPDGAKFCSGCGAKTN